MYKHKPGSAALCFSEPAFLPIDPCRTFFLLSTLLLVRIRSNEEGQKERKKEGEEEEIIERSMSLGIPVRATQLRAITTARAVDFPPWHVYRFPPPPVCLTKRLNELPRTRASPPPSTSSLSPSLVAIDRVRENHERESIRYPRSGRNSRHSCLTLAAQLARICNNIRREKEKEREEIIRVTSVAVYRIDKIPSSRLYYPLLLFIRSVETSFNYYLGIQGAVFASH